MGNQKSKIVGLPVATLPANGATSVAVKFGDSTPLTVEVEGEGLTCQWQRRQDSEETHAEQRRGTLVKYGQPDPEKILAEIHPTLIKYLNVKPMIPYLHQIGLISLDQQETLLLPKINTDMVNDLVVWLPKTGAGYLIKFLTCLKNSSENCPSHKGIATMLEEKLKRSGGNGANGGKLTQQTLDETGWVNVTGDVTFSGCNEPCLYVSSVRANNTGLYRCRVSNIAGTVYSPSIHLTTVCAPKIVDDLGGIKVKLHTSAMLQVSASCKESMCFMWEKRDVNSTKWCELIDDVKYNGLGTPSLSIPNVEEGDAGLFRCRVHSAGGNVLTKEAPLRIVFAPTVTEGPRHVRVKRHGEAVFTVCGSCEEPMGYRWQVKRDVASGSNISGHDKASLVVADVEEDDVGLFRCVVSSDGGETLTNQSSLRIVYAPVIVQELRDVRVKVHDEVTFNVTATCEEEMVYKWQMKRNNIPDWKDVLLGSNYKGQSTPNLVISDVREEDIGLFRCVVSSEGGESVTKGTSLKIVFAPKITEQPQSVKVKLHDEVTLKVGAVCEEPIIYRWERKVSNSTDWKLVPLESKYKGQGTYILVILDVEEEEIGVYRCMVSSEGGEVATEEVTLKCGALMSSSTPMAPPTLSQAPYTQQPHTSSQHTLTHQHTLPYTQDTMVHTQERTTILAPDSLDQSQPQKKSSTKTSTDSSVQKVNETIMSVKSSFDKSGSLEKRQLRVKTEEATVQSIQSEVKKGPVPYRTDVKSSENSVKSIATSSVIDTASVKGKEIDILFGEEMDEDCSTGPPAGVHQGDEEAEKERDVSDGSQLSRQKARMKFKKSPRQTTHHSQQTQSAIKKPPHYHEASATHTADIIDGDQGKNGDCVFTGPALTLPGPPRQNNSSGSNDKKIVPTCEIPQDSKQQNKDLNNQIHCNTQNSSKVPDDTASVPKPSPKTPSSLSSITSPAQLEGSIIVPCSLTPQTQNNKAKKPNPLPDSQTLAFAFQSRRKKRTHQQTCDKELGTVEGESQSKKMKKGCEVVSEGEGVRGEGERNVVMELEMKKQDAVEVKEANQVTDPEQKGEGKNNTHNNTNNGSFCEINNKPSNTGKQNDPNRDSECKRMKTLPSIMTGLPLLETHEDSEVKCKQPNQPPQPPNTDLNTERKTVKSKKMPSDVELKKSKEKPNSNKSTGQCLSQRTSPTPCTQQTAYPPTPDPTLFLSTRKKRRKSPRDDSMAAPTTPDRPTSRPVSPYTQHTSTTQLALTTTQRTGVSLTTPFTSLVTGGRRTKASDREYTAATLWEDDTNQLDGEDPLINRPDDDVSKKVYKPVYDEDGFVCSRIKPSVQTSRIGRLAAFADSQLSNSSDHTDNVANSLPEAVAEIVFARLVVVTNDRGKKRRREGTRKMDERTNNGVRNFKKFHKIQHIGLGTIPRLVSLKEYVPPTSRELQDWIGEYENISEVDQEQQDSSSQDLFRFTTITTSSRRQHRRT